MKPKRNTSDMPVRNVVKNTLEVLICNGRCSNDRENAHGTESDCLQTRFSNWPRPKFNGLGWFYVLR